MLPTFRHSLLLVACFSQSLMLAASTSAAEVVDDKGTWLSYFADSDLPVARNDRLRFWFDGQLRFLEDSDGFELSLLRPGIGYRLGESATLWGGYAWIYSSPAGQSNFDEHRIWQQLTWSEKFRRLSLGHRSRLEQRFLETGSDTGWRFRQQFAVRRPLESAPQITLVAWDEVLIHLNDTDWGADTGFDQNRAFAGLGWKFNVNSPYRIEVGYLNQYIDRSQGEDKQNHVLSINLFWNP